MLTSKMQKALNGHINAEMYSAYLYLSMSAYFQDRNLPGFANWMNIQFQEEWAHAMKFFNYIVERGGRVELEQIEKPKFEWQDAVDVMEETLKHEQLVTSLINNLMHLAHEERDYASVSMLQWFVDEQVEEEANATAILEKLKMIEGKGSGMFMLDNEFAARVFVDPNQNA
jgi:ferritin